jgi:hypothetical protein
MTRVTAVGMAADLGETHPIEETGCLLTAVIAWDIGTATTSTIIGGNAT